MLRTDIHKYTSKDKGFNKQKKREANEGKNSLINFFIWGLSGYVQKNVKWAKI